MKWVTREPAADVARVARETGAIAKARRTIGRRK
jgi:hypothetical protein